MSSGSWRRAGAVPRGETIASSLSAASIEVARFEPRRWDSGMRSVALTIFASVVVVATAATATAGTITVDTDPGERAAVGLLSPGTIRAKGAVDEDNDGKVTFVFSDEKQKEAETVAIVQIKNGRTVRTNLELQIGTLPDLEPFSLPVFAPVSALPLLGVSFTSDSLDFSGVDIGDVLSVSGGGSALLDGVGFFVLDPPSDPDNPLLDFTGQPFTGDVTLASFNTLTPIPLPAAGWMLLAGAGALAAAARRRGG